MTERQAQLSHKGDHATPAGRGSGSTGGITSGDTNESASASASASAIHDSAVDAEQIGRPRTATTTAEIDSTIIHPGSVKINVKGAFIVEQDSATPVAQSFNGGRGSPDHHQTKDIRLPNHTAVVSHIAVDVSLPFTYFSRLSPPPGPATADSLCDIHRLAAPWPSLSTSRARASLPSPAAVSTSPSSRPTG